MINIIGLLLLVIGSFIPYLSEMRVPFLPFFWLGGLLFLNKGIIIKDKLKWHKWAQIGILIHIAVVTMSLLIFFSIGYGSITRFEYWLERVVNWVSSPVTAVLRQIFPYAETHYPSGAVSFQVSHLRSIIEAFFNVAAFAFGSALIGIFCKNRQEEQGNSEQITRTDPE